MKTENFYNDDKPEGRGAVVLASIMILVIIAIVVLLSSCSTTSKTYQCGKEKDKFMLPHSRFGGNDAPKKLSKWNSQSSVKKRTLR